MPIYTGRYAAGGKREKKGRRISRNDKNTEESYQTGKEGFSIPRGVQDIIPIRRIYDDGIFQVGKNMFSRLYQFEDINYYVASKEDKEVMFLSYCELLNSLDSNATAKLTINNRRLNRWILKKTSCSVGRMISWMNIAGNITHILLDKATGTDAFMQEKYITISVVRKNVEEARAYFRRAGSDLISAFSRPRSDMCRSGHSRAS